MKLPRSSFIKGVVLVLLPFSLKIFAIDCSQAKKGEIYLSSLKRLHPTQFAIGFFPAKEKSEKIEKAYREGKLTSYLRKKIAPAIVGPDCRYYILDRHHTSYGVLKAQIPITIKRFYIQVKHNWSRKSTKDFELLMKKNGYVWLKDHNHRSRYFFELPFSLKNLKDDYYRSLAYVVRETGGFRKVKIPFLEFYWGSFFKNEGIKLHSSKKKDILKVLKKALELAKSSHASHLPGFIGN